MERHLKTRAGFSLIEMCIAMLIFGSAFLMLRHFSLNAQLGSKDARSRYVASLVAEKKMRELRIAPYVANDSDVYTSDNVTCNRKWVITDTNFVKRIIVTVRYTSFHGADRSLTLTGVAK